MKYSDETRIGACADYLLDKNWKLIEDRWGVSHMTILKWIRRTGSFKLRQPKKGKRRI